MSAFELIRARCVNIALKLPDASIREDIVARLKTALGQYQNP